MQPQRKAFSRGEHQVTQKQKRARADRRTGREAAEGESPRVWEAGRTLPKTPGLLGPGTWLLHRPGPGWCPVAWSRHPPATSRLSGPRLLPISSAPGLSPHQLRPGFSRVPSEVDGRAEQAGGEAAGADGREGTAPAASAAAQARLLHLLRLVRA